MYSEITYRGRVLVAFSKIFCEYALFRPIASICIAFGATGIENQDDRLRSQFSVLPAVSFIAITMMQTYLPIATRSSGVKFIVCLLFLQLVLCMQLLRSRGTYARTYYLLLPASPPLVLACMLTS